MHATPIVSLLIRDIAEIFADAPRAGLHIDGELCADYARGLAEMAEHVAALEAVARAAGLLDQRDFMAAVGSLPTTDRRSLARQALRQAKGPVVPLPHRRVPGSAYHGFSDGRDGSAS